MAKVTPQMVLAFQDELEKQAAFPAPGAIYKGVRGLLSRQGTTAGGLGALGGAVGAAGGGVGGAVKGYREARQQGATAGQAALGGLGGLLSGAVKGGIIGTAAGAGAGLMGGRQARQWVHQARGGFRQGGKTVAGTSASPVQSILRFGERQVHGMTGAVPRGFSQTAKGQTRAIRAMGAGAAPQVAEAREATKALQGLVESGASQKAISRATGKAEQAGKALEHAKWLEREGATSLPGLAGSMWRAPGETIKHTLGREWHSGPMAKAFSFGLPAAAAGHALISKDKPGETETKGSRVGRALVGGLGYMAPLPIMPMLALSSGLERVGGAAGKGVERLTQPRQSYAAYPGGYY